MLEQSGNLQSWLSPQAIAAVIGAATLVIVTFAQLRQQRKNSREIEQLRTHLQTDDQIRVDHLRQYLEVYAQGHEHELEAFRESLRSAQVVRDRLRRLAEYPATGEKKSLLQALAALADSVTDTYGQNQVYFGETDREIAHSLKRHSIHAIETVRQSIVAGNHAQITAMVPALIAPVTEAQTRLRQAATLAARRTYDELRAGVSVNVQSD